MFQVRLTNQFEEGQQFNVHLVSAPKEIRHSAFVCMVVHGYTNKKLQIFFIGLLKEFYLIIFDNVEFQTDRMILLHI